MSQLGKIAAEMQQLRANAAADYAGRKQLITKKKVRLSRKLLIRNPLSVASLPAH